MKLYKVIILLILILIQTFSHSEEPVVDDNIYNQKSFELSAVLYGVIEIGGKSCKAAGIAMPNSLVSWYGAVNGYQKGEESLATSLNVKQADINKKLKELSGSSSNEKQLELYKVDISSMDISINAIEGENGRLPLRANLLKALDEALKANLAEHEKNVAAFKNLAETVIPDAVASAKAACDRKKKVKVCTKDANGSETCINKEEKDPVPGCELALKMLPDLRGDTLKKYEDIYSLNQVPSTELNNKMEAIEVEMNDKIKSVPASNDSKFDWTIGVTKSVAAMVDVRKNAGIKCPSTADSKSYDRSTLDNIAPEKNTTSTMPEQVSAGTARFLSNIGSDSSKSAAGDTFSSAWNIADTVIGQPGQRAAYFKYIIERVGELNAMDESYLARAKINKNKYLEFTQKVQVAAEAGTSISDSIAAKKAEPGPSNNNSNIISGNNGSNSAISENLNSFKSSTGLTATSNSTKMVAANSNSTGNKSSNQLSKVENSGLSAVATAAIALDKTKRENLLSVKSLSTNSMKVLENAKIQNPVLVNANSRTVVNADEKIEIVSNPNLMNEKMNINFEKLSAQEYSSELYRVASYRLNGIDPSIVKAAINESNKSQSQTKAQATGYTNTYKPVVPTARVKKTANTASPIVKNSVESELINQVIKAKSTVSKNAYKSDENDSLFDKVTKAYIRNYESVGPSD